VDFFNALRIDLTPELERYVDEILENILSKHFITQSTSNLTHTSSSKKTSIFSKFNSFSLI